MNESDKRLTEAMQSAVAIMEGKADPSTYRVHIFADPDVRAMALSTEAYTRRADLIDTELASPDSAQEKTPER